MNLDQHVHTLSLGAAVLLALSAPPLAAQEHQHPPVVRVSTAAPERTAHRRITAPMLTHAPRIDGRITPAEWDGAERLSGFVQRDPTEGAAATEVTEVLVARDAQTLYVAFIAWDRDIAQVRAVHTARDQLAAASDLVGLWLDPLGTGTRAFGFQFNPLGVQYDGVWSRTWDTSWDGVLRSQGTLSDDRYVVEVALPIATLVAGETPDVWDVNFSRTIGRRSEESWWAPMSRARRMVMLADFGELAGMASQAAGARLEAIPTVVAASSAAADGRTWSQEVGLTTRLPLGGSVRLDATVNPDFSFVEGDDAQIATNERWALFYPEKRPFFLEGADQFGTPGANFVADPLRLVHTRTVARPRAGVRLTASPRGGFVGAVVTAQDRFDGTPDGSSMILRLLRQQRNSSQAGLTFTHRDRPDGRRNSVAAGDAQLRLGTHVTTTTQLAVSRTLDAAGPPRTVAAGYVDLSRNDGNGFQELVLRRVPAGFETDIGFVPRSDLMQGVVHLGHYWRPQARAAQWINPMLQVVGSLDDAGDFADLEWLPHVEVQFARETNLWVAQRIRTERFRDRTHSMQRTEARIRSKPRAWLDVGTGVRVGTRLRYDPDVTVPDRSAPVPYTEWSASSDVRLGRSGSLSAAVVQQSLGALPGLAAQSLWLVRTRAAWQFDNVTAVRLLVQHDPDRGQWAQSLVVAHERDYGTQYHLGVQRGWDAEAVASGGGELRVFVRASHRVVIR